MINPRISADWSATKPIAPLSCTPGVQEVHTKDEVLHLTCALLEHMINPRISADWSATKPIALQQVYKKYIPKMRSYTLPLVS